MTRPHMFADRQDAGRRLALELLRFKDHHPVVLALTRGGVPVGFEVATALEAPLDIILVRKIGVPWQPELALGAVTDGDQVEIVINRALMRAARMPKRDVVEAIHRELEEIERRRAIYMKGRRPLSLKDCTALVVDDGIATGSTMQAALRGIRRRGPAHIVLAVPVASPDSVRKLRPEADEIVCLEAPDVFAAVGQFYTDFRQVSDHDVVEILMRAGRSSNVARPKRASA